MRIENQPPVYSLVNNHANPNQRPHNTRPETALSVDSNALQSTPAKDNLEKQDFNNEMIKNQTYNSSGQANRLPGTVTLFDTIA